MKRAIQGLTFVALIGGAALGGYYGGAALHRSTSGAGGDSSPSWSASEDLVPAAATRLSPAEKDGGVPTVTLPDFADIVEHVSPSVVSVNASKFQSGGRSQDGRFFNDPFEYFFGPQGPNSRPPDRGQPRREDSGGTGFLISADGYILTNYHVVENAERVEVTLHGEGGEYKARIVGSDPATDVALLKIDAGKNLPHLPLGNSDRLRVGEWVMAIGNPFFYQDTVTVGVVSAKGRRLDGLSRDASLDNYIQTDAAINQGNSGGPLLNLRGEVVGINTAVSRIGQGIGFAIPINIANDILPQLRESGRVARGAIGVQIRDIATLDADEREYHGLKDVSGALIEHVKEGEPAARAGLKPGDAVIAIDGKSLRGSEDLIGRISAKKPGEAAELTVLRDGRRREFTVHLEDRAAMYAANTGEEPAPEDETPKSAAFDQIGIEVAELTAGARRQYDLPADLEGVVITDVAVRGEAYDKGLRPGMIISEVNRRPVASVREFRTAVDAVEPGGLLTFYIELGEDRGNFVTFRVGGSR